MEATGCGGGGCRPPSIAFKTLTDLVGDVNHPLKGAGLRLNRYPRRVQVFKAVGIRQTGIDSILWRLDWWKRR